MSMLVISTQVRENYGAHDWDGTGECPQYWKDKGGHEYKVLNVDVNRAGAVFELVRSQCESDNEYFQEYVITWSVEPDDYLSWFEKSQLEYDGTIQFPEPVLEVA